MMKTNKTIQKIKKTLLSGGLISRGDRVLIGLSGGEDSVFLLNVLSCLSGEMGFEIGACHVEHGIRGEEAVRDMEFSRELSGSLNVPFYAERFNIPLVAKEEKISVETAARNVRYSYFEKVRKEHGFNLIATAHHRDDKAETVFMNIIRGCSLRGFAGIEYKNGNIIRPLLDISKKEISDFCREYNINYCTDSTNDDTDYTRNRVRHVIFPRLKEINPSFEESLARQSEILTCEDDFLNRCGNDAFDKCVTYKGIDISKLLSFHKALQRRVIYKYIEFVKGDKNDISYIDVENVLSLCTSGKTGSKCSFSATLEGEVSYGKFVIKHKKTSNPFEYKISLGETIKIKEAGVKITLLETGGNLKILHCDSVVIRSRKDGDLFYPSGMKGSKKLKDYFIDKKIPADERSTIPILTVNGEIASVIGMRNDRRFECADGTCSVIIENI